MKRLFRIIDGGKPGKRLRGLEEFETPEFVGSEMLIGLIMKTRQI